MYGDQHLLRLAMDGVQMPASGPIAHGLECQKRTEKARTSAVMRPSSVWLPSCPRRRPVYRPRSITQPHAREWS